MKRNQALIPANYQGKEFTSVIQAPTLKKLNSMLRSMESYAHKFEMDDFRVISKGKDPDGGYRAVVEAHNWNPLPWIKEKGEKALRATGRAAKATGRAIKETAAGFAEEFGPIPIPSPRAIGRGIGIVTKEGAKAIGGIEFRDPGYIWGKGQYAFGRLGPSAPEIKYRPSRLRMQLQEAMAYELGEMYPEVYETLREEGQKLSVFIGKLKVSNPEAYQDVYYLASQKLGPVGYYPQLTGGY